MTHPANEAAPLAAGVARIADATAPERGLFSPIVAQKIALDALWHGYQAGRAEAIRELLTTEDMAALLGVSRRRVQALAKRRGIGWSVGRDILFRPEDIERMQPGLPGRPSRA